MKRAIDTLTEQPEIEVPFEVYCVTGKRTIMFAGDVSSIGEDFVSLEQTRAALEWYVNQYGGNVVWDSGKLQTKKATKQL